MFLYYVLYIPCIGMLLKVKIYIYLDVLYPFVCEHGTELCTRIIHIKEKW